MATSQDKIQPSSSPPVPSRHAMPGGPETPLETPPPLHPPVPLWRPSWPSPPQRRSCLVSPIEETAAEKERREEQIIDCCARARLVLKKLCEGSAVAKDKMVSDMENSQVTLLTCYYVQQYFHPKHEAIIGEKETLDVTATGCIFIACKVADHPRRMKNLVRAYNQVLQEEKKRELSDEDQTQLVDRILRVEFVVLRAVAFHFDVLLPLEFLDQHTDRLIEGLFSNADFAAAYPYDRKFLRSNLYIRAVKFCVDGYAGNPALSKSVENISLASLVFSARMILRSRAVKANPPKVCEVMDRMPELVSFMVEGELTEEKDQEVKDAIENIMKVFKRGQRK